MRLRTGLTVGLLTTLLVSAHAQRREGTFVPAGGTGVSWRINEHHTLIWNGNPYLPVGVRVDGNVPAIKAAAAAGIKDVIVDLPVSGSGWGDVLPALEAAGMRYLIRIGSLAPAAHGYAIDPQANRLTGIASPQTVTLPLPGAESAYALLASRRDSSIAQATPLPVNGGKITFNAKPGGEIEHVLLLYPETSSLEQPDLWERFDQHRDALLTTLRRYPAGPGFRGLVNPIGRTLSLPGRELRFVPTSRYFRMELREQLEKRYRAVEVAIKSWGLGTNSYQTFDELVNLIPLWNGNRGVGLALDTRTMKTVSANMKQSTMWSDIVTVINTATSRRLARLTDSVRRVTDVPVVQEWSGWAGAYENDPAPVDGVGMRAIGGSPSAIAQSASRASSTVMRWNSNGWLPATELEMGSGSDAVNQLAGSIDDVTSLGARGVFVRADDDAALKAVAAEAAKRAADTSIANSSPRPIFFPENATNPAVVQRLPGNAWWLPAPSDGNRIDLGGDFFAYRMRQRDVGMAVAMWARLPGRYLLRVADPKPLGFQTLDGSDPKPKIVKGGIEVALSEFPILITGTDEIPIPDAAYAETLAQFSALLTAAATMKYDASEERVSFRNLTAGFDRNPGGNFPMMRYQIQKVSERISLNTWIEAERTPFNNFSDTEILGGCSGNGALTLRTTVPQPGGFYAEYKVLSRTSSDQEVWIAARIPKERRADFTLAVSGQTMRIQGEPVGGYGDGFGWYRLGTTRLNQGSQTVRIDFKGGNGGDASLDVILLEVTPFRPNGITQPDAIDYAAYTKKK